MKPFPSIILPTAYFGPVQYFARIATAKKIIIEQFDHYVRQTYRNRCVILGANGRIILSIPVVNTKNTKVLVKDIRIDYSTPWQRIHRHSIISAYKNAPFFEFYFDEFEWIFSNRTNFLIELNTRLTDSLMTQIGIRNFWKLSENFLPLDPGSDLRNLISPKTLLEKDKEVTAIPYTQVFSDKHGFLQNLSILDLLFNKGPDSKSILVRSIIKGDYH